MMSYDGDWSSLSIFLIASNIILNAHTFVLIASAVAFADSHTY